MTDRNDIALYRSGAPIEDIVAKWSSSSYTAEHLWLDL